MSTLRPESNYARKIREEEPSINSIEDYALAVYHAGLLAHSLKSLDREETQGLANSLRYLESAIFSEDIGIRLIKSAQDDSEGYE